MIFPRSMNKKDRKGHDGVVLKCMDLKKHGGGDLGHHSTYIEGRLLRSHKMEEEMKDLFL